jgi:hypothetical protein
VRIQNGIKMKRILKFGVALALIACLTAVANAALVTYDWVPDAALNGVNTSSGSLTWDGSSVGSFSFTLNNVNTTTFAQITGTTVLTDGNLVFVGKSDTTQAWAAHDVANTPDENVVKILTTPTAYGDWVAVPEPTTLIAGLSLLLPFGASTLRALRKRRMA